LQDNYKVFRLIDVLLVGWSVGRAVGWTQRAP
jgi:hypothetical protein